MPGEEVAAGPSRGAAAADEDGAHSSAALRECNGARAAGANPAARSATPAPYVASLVKRERATKADMEDRAEALIAIVDRSKPCTVRQVFYQATVRGIVEKTEAGYAKVQRQLADLRRAGRIPFASIADNTRWRRKPVTFDSLTEAVEHAAQTYRRAVWSDVDVHVEVWLEKDALAGVLYPVTDLYDIPLMVSRGYASLSYLYEAASFMRELEKRVVILHFGDYDPSGQDAAAKIEATLREFAPEIEIQFFPLAVTERQIRRWRLPSRPTKQSDTRSRTWTGGDSVELDAIEANQLRALCRHWIEAIIPDGWLKTLQAAEESERELLANWAEAVTYGERP